MNAVEPATSSLDDRRLFIEPEGLESSHDLLPLIDDTGVVEVSESNTNASAEEQKVNRIPPCYDTLEACLIYSNAK